MVITMGIPCQCCVCNMQTSILEKTGLSSFSLGGRGGFGGIILMSVDSLSLGYPLSSAQKYPTYLLDKILRIAYLYRMLDSLKFWFEGVIVFLKVESVNSLLVLSNMRLIYYVFVLQVDLSKQVFLVALQPCIISREVVSYGRMCSHHGSVRCTRQWVVVPQLGNEQIHRSCLCSLIC